MNRINKIIPALVIVLTLAGCSNEEAKKQVLVVKQAEQQALVDKKAEERAIAAIELMNGEGLVVDYTSVYDNAE
jgi:uncharacterized lipoprotein NlpE involved in copper resistance